MTDLVPHHAEHIVQAHRRLDAHDMRLLNIEIAQAREAERSVHIQKSLGEIQESIKWVIRLVVGAVIGAGIAYALRGGFHVG
ncbi:hemolysin XhlA family protein [Paracoccus sp. 11-3]|uniref:Hemolysin XhlA family protein n=1 Tax=Paracoccus amoyensis TaxID=2760093 RepID=A0A926JDA7_9RHOB|nr:hemolysin XhlA family protein [Paracoccus amoyensis]